MQCLAIMKQRIRVRAVRDGASIALWFLLGGIVGCGNVAPDVTARTEAELLAAGPFGVGVAQARFIDPARPTQASGAFPGSPERRLDCWVWYPIDRPVVGLAGVAKIPEPSRSGKFPLVLLSHGLSAPSNSQQYVSLHLASHGYVVVAPTFPLTSLSSHTGVAFDVTDLGNQPGDVSFVLDRMLAIANGDESAPSGFPDFREVIDTGKIAAAGLSFGAFTTHLLNFASNLRDDRLDAAVLYAVGDMSALAQGGDVFGLSGGGFTPVSAPSLYFSGSRDLLTTPEGSRKTWATVRSPAWHAEIVGGTHIWFADSNAPIAGYENPDLFACEFVRGGIGGSIGGGEVLPCTDDGKDPIVSPPSRQHDFVLAGTLAFLDGILRGDQASIAFLESGFGGASGIRVDF